MVAARFDHQDRNTCFDQVGRQRAAAGARAHDDEVVQGFDHYGPRFQTSSCSRLTMASALSGRTVR